MKQITQIFLESESPTLTYISEFSFFKNELLLLKQMILFVEKYSSEAFSQRRSVKAYSKKFRKIHRKMPLPETLFYNVAYLGLQDY